VSVATCQFAQDYLAMIDLVRTLGTTPGVAPQIFVGIPAPLMAHGAIGANQTVINSVYPAFIPLIAAAAGVTTVPISIFSALGGVPDWQKQFPPSCERVSPWAPCANFCDAQSCDQCHPNNNGYGVLAAAMKKGMNL
jgi:hypothetical protein